MVFPKHPVFHFAPMFHFAPTYYNNYLFNTLCLCWDISVIIKDIIDDIK